MTKFRMRKIFSVVLLAISLLSGCQDAEDNKEQAQKRLQKGKELLEKGDFKSAELELKSAIQKDNKTADSYYYLALLNEKNKKYPSMKKNLLQAVKLNPENMDARLKLSKVLLIFNETDDARIEIDVVLNNKPNDPDALSSKAAILIRQKKQGEALAIVDDILQNHPGYTQAASLKALILMENEQFDEAMSIIDSAIEEDIDNIDLYLLKVQINAKQNNINAVIENYNKLVELKPENHQLKYALAKLYVQAGGKQEAEKLLRGVVASSPKKIRPKLVLLDFLEVADKEKSNEQMQTFIAENRHKPGVLLVLSEWLLQRKKIDEAQSLLEEIVKDPVNSEKKQQAKLKAKLQLAGIAFNKRDIKTTKEIIEELLEVNPNNLQARILKAKIYVAQEKYNKAADILTKVLWSDPQSDETMVLLGQIDLLQGHPLEADRRFRAALEINPANMDALKPVVRRSLSKNDLNYASAVLNKALRMQPKNVAVLTNLAKINMIKQDWDVAQNLVNTIASQPGGNRLAKFLHGVILQEQGNCDQAVVLFKEVLNNAPNQLDALREMAKCHEVLQQRSVMMAYLTLLLEQNPNNIAALLIKSKLYLLNKKYASAISALEKARQINNKTPVIYVDLAEIYQQKGDLNKVVSTYKQGLDAIPDNIKLSLLLGNAYLKMEEIDQAAAVYGKLLVKYPRLDIAANNLAILLIDNYGSEQDVHRARELVKRFKKSDQVNFIDTYAWTQLKAGKTQEALKLLKKINIMSPNTAVYKYHLGVAYKEQGDKFSAINELNQAIDLGKKEKFSELPAAQKLLNELKAETRS